MLASPLDVQNFNHFDDEQNDKSNNYEEVRGKFQKMDPEVIEEGENEEEYTARREFQGLIKLTQAEYDIKQNHFIEDYNVPFETKNLHKNSFWLKMNKDPPGEDEEFMDNSYDLKESKEETKGEIIAEKI